MESDCLRLFPVARFCVRSEDYRMSIDRGNEAEEAWKEVK